MAPRLLTPTVFHILLALSGGSRHGYEIIKQVERDTEGQIVIAPGTLYNALHRLAREGTVCEVGERPAPDLDDERRRYYALTAQGQQALAAEVVRLRRALALAGRRLGRGESGLVG